MDTTGAFEAKTHLAPADAIEATPSHREIIESMRALRKRVKSDNISIKE
jgi:hypothetical protein